MVHIWLSQENIPAELIFINDSVKPEGYIYIRISIPKQMKPYCANTMTLMILLSVYIAEMRKMVLC